MSDLYQFDYSNPKFDQQKNQWYWEGRRADTGKKIRKYANGQSQTPQYDANQYSQTGYESAPYDASTDIQSSMQGMSLQEQSVDQYGTGASNYATWQAGPQTQGHRRRDEGVASGYQATPRTLPVSSGYQEPAASTSEQSPQSRLISRHGTTPAVYGDGGDAGAQDFEQRNGGYVAVQRPAQDASLLEPNSSGYYDQSVDSYGTSQYGQSPSIVFDDGQPRDKSRRSKHKGKGKAVAEGNAYEFRDERPQHGDSIHSGGRDPRRPSGTSNHTAELLHGQGDLRSSVSRSQPATFQGDLGDNGEDAALRAGIDASRAAFDYGGTGGTSSRGGAGPAYQAASGKMPPPTPYPRSSHGTHIRGTKGQYEPLDPRFRIEHSQRFEPGEVFKVMWTEPLGEKTPVGGGSVITEVALQDHKNNVWTGFRRFIVVGNDEGHCTCVPILTYGNQGCQKRGVKPHKHGIVYEQGTVASALPNEPKLGFQPICMQMTAANEHISNNSRVNYSKLVSVEHNVKVFFIGRISNDDWPTVQHAVDKCWEDQLRERPHHISRRDKK